MKIQLIVFSLLLGLVALAGSGCSSRSAWSPGYGSADEYANARYGPYDPFLWEGDPYWVYPYPYYYPFHGNGDDDCDDGFCGNLRGPRHRHGLGANLPSSTGREPSEIAQPPPMAEHRFPANGMSGGMPRDLPLHHR